MAGRQCCRTFPITMVMMMIIIMMTWSHHVGAVYTISMKGFEVRTPQLEEKKFSFYGNFLRKNPPVVAQMERHLLIPDLKIT